MVHSLNQNMKITIDSRNSNIEILRIISILLIIAWHICTQFGHNLGGVLATGSSVYHLFSIVIGSWGQLGVDLFVIISAYYLSKKNVFKIRKLIDLLLETVFYGLLSVVVCEFVLKQNLPYREMVKSVFSVFFGVYWFITAYVLLYIFSPMLNKIIKCLSNADMVKITVLLGVFVACYKTVYSGAPVCDFLYFVFIYFLVNVFNDEKSKKMIMKFSKKGGG